MTYCPSCGREIAEDDRFCRACGKDLGDPLTSAAPAANAAPSDPELPPLDEAPPSPPPTATKRRRWLVPVAVIAVVVVAAVVGAVVVENRAAHQRTVKAAQAAARAAAKAVTAEALAAEVASEKSAADSALKPFRKVDSALTVGVLFADYGTLLQNAQYALDSYSPTDDTGTKLRKELAAAMALFSAADTAWNDANQMTFSGGKTSAAWWKRHYPGLKDYLGSGTVTATKVEQSAWTAAGVHVGLAESDLLVYGQL